MTDRPPAGSREGSSAASGHGSDTDQSGAEIIAAAAAYPHGDTICVGCHTCQPERVPNTSGAYCGCRVCNPTGAPLVISHVGHLLGASPEGIERAVVVAERMVQQDALVAVAAAARAYVAGSPDDEVALFDALREAVEELDG